MKAKNASAVILLRPADGGAFEVFMRRPGSPGGLVGFPGGAVRDEDWTEGSLKRCRGLSRREARAILGNDLAPEPSLGHWVAGIRALFEEVGVLLCASDKPRARVDTGLEGKRGALIDGSMSFQALLESEGLCCDAARLAYFSRWLTPGGPPLRYDTRFFLALLPEESGWGSSSQEIDQGLWARPDRALDRSGESDLSTDFPTFASLRTLADFDSLTGIASEYRLK